MNKKQYPLKWSRLRLIVWIYIYIFGSCLTPTHISIIRICILPVQIIPTYRHVKKLNQLDCIRKLLAFDILVLVNGRSLLSISISGYK